MSRVGKKPIPIPSGVKVHVGSGSVDVEGPKGKRQQLVPPGIRFEEKDGTLTAYPVRENDKSLRKFHGLARSLVANAVHGVEKGFAKELDIVGIGYRAEVAGKQVLFSLGYSHVINFDIPTGIDVAIEKQTHVTVSGIDPSKHLTLPVTNKNPYESKTAGAGDGVRTRDQQLGRL